MRTIWDARDHTTGSAMIGLVIYAELSKLKVGRLLSWKGASLALFTWLLVILSIAHQRDAATLGSWKTPSQTHLTLSLWWPFVTYSVLCSNWREVPLQVIKAPSRQVIALNQWKLGKNVKSWDGEVQKLSGHDGSATLDFASSANDCKDAWSPFSACEQEMHRATSTTPVTCHKDLTKYMTLY